MPGRPAPAPGGRGVVGAVLCGGASRRMGRDKALIEVEGTALARRVADALTAGGCGRVVAVGGDEPSLVALGFEVVADRWPGEGPLGGLATALGAAGGADALVVAPCDLLSPSAVAVARLLARLDAAGPDVDVVAGEVDGRVEWILSAWRPGAEVAAAVAALVRDGRRRLGSVAEAVRWERCPDVGADDLRDADAPSDLPSSGSTDRGARRWCR